MILYSLTCSAEHEFEAWFRDGATYEAQVSAGEVACPVCADTEVAKAPMAPRIAKGASRPAEETAERPPAQTPASEPEGAAEAGIPAPAPKLDPRLREMARIKAAVLTLKKLVEDNCEHVGADFAKEARRIHNGEADERAIYGDASEEEAEALEEEGIPVGRIPWPSSGDA